MLSALKNNIMSIIGKTKDKIIFQWELNKKKLGKFRTIAITEWQFEIIVKYKTYM